MTPEKSYVRALSANSIRISTEKILAPILMQNKLRLAQIDVVHLYEFHLSTIAPGFSFRIKSDAEMGETYSYTTFDPKIIFIAQSVFRNASEGDARARFTLAHELGHAILHVDYGKNYTAHRAIRSHAIQGTYVERVKNPEAFRDPEWQANKFASFLLMPNFLVNSCNSSVELSDLACVSRAAAELRWKSKNSLRS